MNERGRLRFWGMVKGWALRTGRTKPDYGSGYYVRSTAHPVVPGPPMTHEEAVEALNSLDAVYEPPKPAEGE